MLLTRIWAFILAVLATGCLAGMFLLSRGSSGDFTRADREAVRAVTEAGLAALQAEIQSSPVEQLATLIGDPRVQEALGRTKAQEEDLPGDKYPIHQVLGEAAEQLRVQTDSDVTVAVIESTGEVLVANGVAEAAVSELVATEAYQAITGDQQALFAVTLGGDIHVAKVSRMLAQDRRLVAIERLDIGGGSMLRRVLGSDTPAALVRKGEIIGEPIGGRVLVEEIQQLAKEHESEVPEQGASKVFTIGEGLDARLGAMGRVPGPAGRGPGGAMLVVLSTSTAAAGQRDLAETARRGWERGLGPVTWVLLAGLLAISGGLAIYLPQLEGIGPLRRLRREFEAIAQGAQHQIFHDRYGGPTGEVARAAATVHEALRQAYLAELEIDDEVVEEQAKASRRARTTRGRRLPTRGLRKLPDAVADAGAPQPATDEPSSSRRLAEPGPPTPAQHDPIAAEPQPATAAPPQPSPPPVVPPRPAPRPSEAKPTAAASAPPPATPGSTSQPATPSPAVSSPTASDASSEDPKEAEYREIFEEFLQVKVACGESTTGLTFERFAAKLRKQSKDLMAKRPGIKDVQFSVYVKDGKAALKAKVVKA